MAPTEDKDLEDGLVEVGSQLTSPPSDVDELISLLDKTEQFLTKIDQSPSSSTSAALQPAMKALVANFFLDHPDEDVKVSVASCVSEITRITAPDAPYDDDLMKVIFQVIVETFKKLDDTSSRSFLKRVSILETVAKVRSCVVMLDLECDALILEMFRHFLKTIRSNHPEGVFSSMAMIMTLVLEESEDISLELLSCLLDSMKDNEDVLPIARKLGEKVVRSSVDKIKPYLTSYDLNEYSKLVTSISQDNSDASEHIERNVPDALEQHTDRNVSDEIVADESKLSERTVSDELPEGPEMLQQEVASIEKVHPSVKSPKSVTSNGRLQKVTEDIVVQPAHLKQKPERSRRGGQSKRNISVDRTDSDNLESVDVKSNSALDIKTKQKNSHNATGLAQNDSDKEIPSASSRRKGRKKKVDCSQLDVPSLKESEPVSSLEPLEKNDLQAPHSSDNDRARVSSPTPSGNARDKVPHLKRGRTSGSKAFLKRIASAVTDQPASASVGEEDLGNSQTQDASVPSDVNDSKEEVEATSIEKKSHGRASKKAPFVKADGGTPAIITSDSEAKPSGSTGKRGYRKKVMEGESPKKQLKSDIKQRRGKIRNGKDAAGDLSMKEVANSPKSSRNTKIVDQSYLEDSIKTPSRRKRPRGTEEIYEMPDHGTKLDESLVGSKIQVWWPDDKRFYNGIVDSFDPNTGEHKIVYDDNDIEILQLKNEKYKIVEDGSEASKGKDVQEVQWNKKARENQDSLAKQEMKDASPKSGTESGPKQRGRPRGRASTKPDNLSPDGAKTPRKSKEKAATDNIIRVDDTSDAVLKHDSSKGSGKAKNVPSKSGRKSRDDTPKSSSKVKDDAQITGSKATDDSIETPKAGSKSLDDSISGKRERRRNKSKEGARKGGLKLQPEESVSRRIKDESISDDTGEKEKEHVSETEAPSREQVEATTGSGTKRKRKSRK